jgi:hypothetical protein
MLLQASNTVRTADLSFYLREKIGFNKVVSPRSLKGYDKAVQRLKLGSEIRAKKQADLAK